MNSHFDVYSGYGVTQRAGGSIARNVSVLKNWTIFQDNRGDVIFKLRFGATDAIKHDAVNTAQHKRKSQSQINRDKLRSDRWRENIKNRHQSQTYRESERSDPLIALNTDTEHTGDCGNQK